MAFLATAFLPTAFLTDGVAPPQTATPGYERARKRRWHVKRPDGRREYFESVDAAYRRFLELFAEPEPAQAKAPKVRRISLPAIPPRTVEYDGADATRDMAKLARDMARIQQDRAAASVAALLREIEADAIRRAAERDDDEAAAILLLLN